MNLNLVFLFTSGRMDSLISTKYGSVALEKLIAVYEKHKENEKKTAERRHEWNQTDEGKQKNRERAKAYYEKNKEKVRAKNLARANANKEKAEALVAQG